VIPLTDDTRRPVDFPIVTVGLIVINTAVFLVELASGDEFIARWAATPADIAQGRHLETVLTSMFMHASWSHIIGNMIFLWAFGPQIEDAMGRVRYALFYVAGGVVAMLAQIAADPTSTVPSLGASGAIAAVMGAFLVTYPQDRIRTVLFFGWFVRITLIPAVFLIGFWFVVQLVSLGSITGAQTGGGVAYMAHVGGLVFGAATARLVERRREPATLT
jgi:membrane associated rhomboid family serine protease